MSEYIDEVWSGWQLIKAPEEATGGAEARHRQHMVDRRRRQLTVLDLLWETHPELVRGESNAVVPLDVSQRWEETLQAPGSASVVEIRHKINFLALGLRRGQQVLGWDVTVPAFMHLVTPPTSPFTPSSFFGLSVYRDWCRHVDAAIQQTGFQKALLHGQGRGQRRVEPELISWGMLLYMMVTRDGLLGSKQLNLLPFAAGGLAAYGSTAWLTLHDDIPDDITGRVPPRSRWLLGVESLAVLMRHVELFGLPNEGIDDYQEAKVFTQASWRHFVRAVGAGQMSLFACQEYAETALRLHVPAYLVNSSRGRHLGTSLTEARWQQLLGGGYVEHASPKTEPLDEDVLKGEEQDVALTTGQQVRDQPLYEGRALLDSLHKKLYKPRDEKRLTFAAISQALNEAIVAAQRMAPVVESLCRWLLFLHQKKKRKQTTLYKYLGVSRPLLQALGDTPVDQARLSHLAEAYQYVVEQAKTEKNRAYRWTILRSLHAFLMADLGLANVQMEFVGGGMSVTHHADANCLTEQEYGLVASHLAAQPGVLGQIRYWIFVLGFRAGLRIGEALSIQLDDVLFHENLKDTEVILLIRSNAYVGTKSHDSRRQLPLHCLMTGSELSLFKAFVMNRHAIVQHGRVMLFGEGGESVRPLRDDTVQVEIHDAMRRITGDPNLRFHHLRHSLANYLLLSFHGVAVPWAAPSHHDALWEEVAGGPSRSGLYFIAQVMGHASPDVTLRSYLHFTGLLIDYYCHRQPASVMDDGRPHSVARLEALGGVVEVKPATLRQWKHRFGDQPPLWLSKIYPQCPIDDVAQQQVTPYPPPTVVIPRREEWSQLSLEQVEAALHALHHRDHESIEKIFSLREGDAGLLESCAIRVLTARTRRGTSAYRHHRLTKGKELDMNMAGLPRLPRPLALSDRQVTYAMYRAIWTRWFEREPQALRRHLRFFYRFHRAVGGHVWIRDVENGLAFVSWVLSLSPDLRAVIEITPSAWSSLPSKEQLKGWQDLLPSQKHKVEWQTAAAGRRFAKELGTGNVAFYVANKDRKVRSGYPVRYTLVMTCIVMAVMAKASYSKPLKY